MGAGTAIIAATTVFSMASQYVQGKQEQKAYEYNAALTEGQIPNIEAAKRVQFFRSLGDQQKMVSAQIATVASSGIELTGSPLEVINADLARSEFDMAVDNYNFEAEKTRVYNQAQMQRYSGRQAYRTGILKAVGTGVKGVASAYAYRGVGDKPLGEYTKIKTSSGSGYRQGSLILAGGRRGYYA